MKLTIAVTMALISLPALADNLVLRGGKALNMRPNIARKVDAQVYSLRLEKVRGNFFKLYEVGGWAVAHYDDEPDLAYSKSSPFLKAGLGYSVGPDVGWYAKGALSLALIAFPDAYCSSPIQLSPEMGVGIRDADHSLQMTYVHFSNAGIKGPNVSRDWLTLEFGLAF